MRFLTATGVAVGVAISSANGPAQRTPLQTPGPEYVLIAGRAGRVELGMSVDDVYRLFGRESVRLVDLFKEGLFSPALQIKLSGAETVPGIVTDIREWPCGEFSVWGIDVLDARFRTKDGFGVGSTVGDLRRSYSFRITEEEGAHAAVVEALKMSFSLSHEGPADQQRVTSVWIWPDPEAVRKKRCPERDAGWPPDTQTEPSRR
jgi:hypothetical protein